MELRSYPLGGRTSLQRKITLTKVTYTNFLKFTGLFKSKPLDPLDLFNWILEHSKREHTAKKVLPGYIKNYRLPFVLGNLAVKGHFK